MLILGMWCTSDLCTFGGTRSRLFVKVKFLGHTFQKTYCFPLKLILKQVKAQIWYAGKSHRYTSAGIKIKAICQSQC